MTLRKRKPVVYGFRDPALSLLPLGACPYCGGKVTFDLVQVTSDSKLFSRPEGFIVWCVKCENTCDLEHFFRLHGEWDSPYKDDAVGILREQWAGACSKLKNLKPCGRCGVKPVWRIQPDSARVECPKCGNGFSDDSEYYEIGRLALKWTMSQSRQGDAYRLESMLNG